MKTHEQILKNVMFSLEESQPLTKTFFVFRAEPVCFVTKATDEAGQLYLDWVQEATVPTSEGEYDPRDA